MEINFQYDSLNRLSAKFMGDPKKPIASLKYTYAQDGTLSAREVNGRMENFQYDAKGQLTAVLSADGNALEKYTYDAAGNILEKTIAGKTTKFSYDAANQLVSSIAPDGKRTDYAYDAAGRMISESGEGFSKSYSYGWLDKVMQTSSTDGGKVAFDYTISGQVASRTELDQTESFTWQGLALIRRDSTDYMTEPHANGGNPLLAGDKVLFNDMLGNSLGAMKDGSFSANERTSFGEAKGRINEDVDFFTGKPRVAGLGYSFLFRNYRADLGKWGTKDPLGYPDGWNNFAYCSNKSNAIDPFGLEIVTDARGLDILNPEWKENIDAVLDYLKTVPEFADIINQMETSPDHTITIMQDNTVHPQTTSVTVGENATIHVDNYSYTGLDGLPYSFSETVAWELMNAYARTFLNDSQGEANYTRKYYFDWIKKLDKTKDPFPYDVSKLWKKPE